MAALLPLILAAGASTRMGHPKALTRIGDETAIERIARILRDAGLCEPIVVTRAGIDVPRVGRIIVNPRPDAGRTGSLLVAIAATNARDVLVWPVDHPLALAGTVRALAATPGAWVVPAHTGRAGHPIVLRGAAIDAVLAARPDAPLRDVLRAAVAAPTRVDVEDAGVLANLDTPDDVRRLA